MRNKDNKRIYVREEAHRRYKAFAATQGVDMLDALTILLDLHDSHKAGNKQDNQQD